jgi:hypothetical protein
MTFSIWFIHTAPWINLTWLAVGWK